MSADLFILFSYILLISLGNNNTPVATPNISYGSTPSYDHQYEISNLSPSSVQRASNTSTSEIPQTPSLFFNQTDSTSNDDIIEKNDSISISPNDKLNLDNTNNNDNEASLFINHDNENNQESLFLNNDNNNNSLFDIQAESPSNFDNNVMDVMRMNEYGYDYESNYIISPSDKW